MISRTLHRYIVSNDAILSGEPIIEGTRTPVRSVVEKWRLGIQSEEIPNHLPHLSPAQVFDALSYYLDHQAEIDEYIERNHVPDDLIGRTFNVCGGEPCIRKTRIPVWLLVQLRKLGMSDPDILIAYPSLFPSDLLNAWSYYRANQAEIDRQIVENEEA